MFVFLLDAYQIITIQLFCAIALIALANYHSILVQILVVGAPIARKLGLARKRV